MKQSNIRGSRCGSPHRLAYCYRLMDDEEVIAFVRQQGLQAQYVTSVCTGSLVLGAAGLLNGYALRRRSDHLWRSW